jgi:hypothetical protein
MNVRQILWFSATILFLAGCAHVSESNDPAHDLRLAAYAGNLEKMGALLKKHPELINAQPDLTLIQTNNFPKRAPMTPPSLIELESEGFAPLHMAAFMGQEKAVTFLLAAGADVNLKDKTGATALHSAAHHGNETLVQELLEGGADVNARTQKGFTPLHWAALGGDRGTVIRLLRQGADLNARTAAGETPLHFAIKQKFPEVIAVLQRRGGTE